MRPFKAAALAAVLPLALANCASIVSDNDSATYIETVPEAARCELHGQDFTRVVNTPSSLQLPSKSAPITVACKTEGYRTTTGVLDTSMDGWIIGNLIFGGIIGVAIDAARGAGQKFPPRYALVLEPEQFPTAAARDEWFDRQRKLIVDKWSKVVETIRNQCSNQTQQARDCGGEINKAESDKAKELGELEARRQRAGVKSA